MMKADHTQPIRLRLVRALRWLITRGLAQPLPGRREQHFCVGIVKSDRLGDGVLAITAIRTVLAHYGEEKCLLIVSPQVEPLMAAEFPRTPRLVLPASVGHWRLFAEGRTARAALSRITCDEVICLRHQRYDWDELILTWLGGHNCRVLEDAATLPDFVARRTFLCAAAKRVEFVPAAVSGDSICRELERHRQMLACALGRTVAAEEVMPGFEQLGAGAAVGGIVVTPFGSAAIRDFPEPLLLAALRAVRTQSAAPIRLYGDEVQQPRLARLTEALQAAGVTNVACAAPMGVVAFAGAIAAAELILTVETATAHLATAFDRPAVIVIGGGHYGEFGPWRRSSRQVWLTERLDCFGCDWSCVHPEPYCLTRITMEKVQAAVAQACAGGELE